MKNARGAADSLPGVIGPGSITRQPTKTLLPSRSGCGDFVFLGSQAAIRSWCLRQRLLDILALRPTIIDLVEASLWLAGSADVFIGRSFEPLAGEFVAILTADEDGDAAWRRRAPLRKAGDRPPAAATADASRRTRRMQLRANTILGWPCEPPVKSS